MTVVVWDGKTLAADQYLSDPYGFFHVKKIGKLNDGSLYGWSGYPHQAMRVINWLNSVRNPDNYPEQTESDKSATVMVISKRKKVTLYNDIAGAIIVKKLGLALKRLTLLHSYIINEERRTYEGKFWF